MQYFLSDLKVVGAQHVKPLTCQATTRSDYQHGLKIMKVNLTQQRTKPVTYVTEDVLSIYGV